MVEKTKNLEKEISIKSTKRYKVAKTFYRATNYQSYHSFRKSLVRINRIFIAAIILSIYSMFVIPQIAYAVQSIVFVTLIGYSFLYAWVMGKSRRIRKDSDDAMTQVELANNVTINSWRFYDGVLIKNDKDINTLEIGLTKDESLIVDIIKIFKKQSITLPGKQEEIDFLKTFISNLQNDSNTKWYIYGTFDNDMITKIKKAGINLSPLSRAYRTKPGRFNYACATGSFKKAFWKYPHFEAYQLTVSEKDN